MHWIFYGMNRFDVLECWSVLAHDYGLYGINSRLYQMGFRPSCMLSYDSLSEDQKFYYAAHEAVAEKTKPYSYKIGE